MADNVRVTLERPFRGGGAHFRYGTSPALRNPNYDPNRPQFGQPYSPGKPILYPSDGSKLVAGDPARDSCIMALLVAKGIFGDWDAPAEQQPNTNQGWVRQNEREMLISRYNLFRYPASNGTQNPDMTVVGLNEFPYVAIRMLDDRMLAERDADGNEIIIRPHVHFGFVDMTFEIHNEEQRARVSAEDDLKIQIAAQQKQIDALLRAMTNGGQSGGKSLQSAS